LMRWTHDRETFSNEHKPERETTVSDKRKRTGFRFK